jgi:hypothetical protein
LLPLLVLIGGSTLVVAGGAGADVGAGIGASPISLAQAAAPGGTYALPSVYVVNTGTDTGRFRLRVQRISTGAARTVPVDWVRIGRGELTLGPMQHALVPLTLVLPASAHPGHYLTDLVFGTVSTSSTPGAHVGAQAATKLEFDVKPASAPSSSWWIWLLMGAAGVLLVVALLAAQRHYRFKVRFERRP